MLGLHSIPKGVPTSPQQQEAVLAAVEDGCYEIPREMDLADLPKLLAGPGPRSPIGCDARRSASQFG